MITKWNLKQVDVKPRYWRLHLLQLVIKIFASRGRASEVYVFNWIIGAKIKVMINATIYVS